MTTELFVGLFNYWVVICLMMTGFYIVISSGNLMKTVIGLNIFQTSVFLLYITMGKIDGGTAPILQGGHGHGHEHGHSELHGHGEPHASLGSDLIHQVSYTDSKADHAHEIVESVGHHAADAVTLYSNPLPSVLMLTAIVVGIATTALALALLVRIREEYGSIEEDDILAMDRDAQ
jgi:multicomponent Na+:H+ antiporter subunit C